MKKKLFSTGQIVAVLRQVKMGLAVADLIRQIGSSEKTVYRRKKQYGEVQSEQVRELKQLNDENSRLKKRVAQLSLDKAVLQGHPAYNRSIGFLLTEPAWKMLIQES